MAAEREREVEIKIVGLGIGRQRVQVVDFARDVIPILVIINIRQLALVAAALLPRICYSQLCHVRLRPEPLKPITTSPGEAKVDSWPTKTFSKSVSFAHAVRAGELST